MTAETALLLDEVRVVEEEGVGVVELERLVVDCVPEEDPEEDSDVEVADVVEVAVYV